MFKKLALAAGLVLSLGAPVALASYNAIPVSETQQGFYDSVVNIRMQVSEDKVGTCTGTLISKVGTKGFILTAAHCVQEVSKIEVEFFPPNYKPGSAPISVPATGWRWAEDAAPVGDGSMSLDNPDNVQDVAVIMVDNVPQHARPAPVADQYQVESNQGDIFAVVRDYKTRFEPTSPLVVLPFENAKTLGSKRLWFDATVVQPGNLPDGHEGLRGMCMGNSGGPVFVNFKGKAFLIGVISSESEMFSVKGESEAFKCGTHAWLYNPTYNHALINNAIKGLLEAKAS
jgi:trypsin